MSRELIGDETDLKKISMKNEWIERKCVGLQRKEEVLEENLQLLEKFNIGVKNHKRRTSTIDSKAVETKRKTSLESIQNSEIALDAAFQKVENVQKNREHVNFPKLSINLPLDEAIRSCELEFEVLQKKEEQITREKESLEKEHIEVHLEKSSVLKSAKKFEKENGMLKSLLNQQKVKLAENRMLAEVKKKLEAEKELESAQETLESLRKTNALKKGQNERTREKLEVAMSLIVNIDSNEHLDIESLRAMAEELDDQELNVLLAEMSALSRTKPLVPPLQKELTPDDTVRNLRKRYGMVSKEKQLVFAEIERINQYKDRHIVANEMLKRKVSGLEDLNRQIAENSEILARLAKEQEARRLFELAAREVPGPELRTPENRLRSKPVPKANMKLAKRVKWAEPVHISEVSVDSKESKQSKETQSSEFLKFFGNFNESPKLKGDGEEDDDDKELIAGRGDYLEQSTWDEDE